MRINFTYIFHGLGLLAILFACLFGLSYVTKGNEILSVAGAMGIILMLGAAVHLMIKSKSNKENKGVTPLEWISYVFYIVIAVGSFFIIRHFINVDYVLKDEIITASNNKLKQNEDMFKEYKKQVDATLDIIDTNLRNVMMKSNAQKRDSFALNGVDPSKISNYTIERENIKASNEKRALEDFVTLEQEFLIFKQKKEQVLRNWQQFRLHRTLLEIDNEYDKSLATLQATFKAPEKNQAWNRFSFDYPTSPRQDNLIESPKALIKKFNPNILMPLLVILLAHFFILMPYLFMERFGIEVIYPRKLKDKVTGF
jgi:hypothetical protein